MSARRHRPFRPRSQSWGPPYVAEPIDESATSVDLEALVASALAEGVEHLVSVANDIIVGCADCAADAVFVTRADDAVERRALAVVLSVLLGIEVSDPAIFQGVPSWLATLPHATVRSVRRRRIDSSWCYLIDVGTADRHVMSAHVVLGEQGEITSGFVVDETIDQLERLVRSVGRERGRNFSGVKVETAAPALLAGFARRRLGRPGQQPETCLSDNDPLITWLVRLVVEVGELRGRAA